MSELNFEVTADGGSNEHDKIMNMVAIEQTGVPEISYYNQNTESIKINLDSNNKELEIDFKNEVKLDLDNEDLDQTVKEISSKLNLNHDTSKGEEPWSNQYVLKGGDGNDVFMTMNREYSEMDKLKVTELLGGKGNDIYIGGNEIEKLSYDEIEEDELTGLFISDDAEHLPIVSNNMPPLIVDEVQGDELLIYKDYTPELNKSEVDIARNIDVVSLSNKDDNVFVNHDSKYYFDFKKGNDLGTIIGGSEPPNFNQFINVEKVKWIPRDEDGQPILEIDGTESSFEFDVVKVKEDSSKEVLIKELVSTDESTEWEVIPFEDNNNNSEDLSWISLTKKDASPEIIGDGNIVIYTKTVEDTDNIEWLEIHAEDVREEGKGLIGLDLDISWNKERYTLTQDELNKSQVFNDDHLPLFQHKGKVTTVNQERGAIENIIAAALPRSGTGVALGNRNEPQPQTLFARIPFKVNSNTSEADIQIEINSFPAAAGEKAERDDLMIFNRVLKDKVWVMQVDATQEQVGKHLISIKSKNSNDVKTKNIILTIENTNDAPIIINKEDLEPNALIINGKEGESIDKNVSTLFADEDGDQLTFEILNGPDWLEIARGTSKIQGIPPADAQGTQSIRIKAMDKSGLSAEREMTVIIENTNQAPKVNKLVPDLVFGQNDNFVYNIPSDLFTDEDFGVDPDEKLTFSLKSTNENNKDQWIEIDENTGKISGRAGMREVGEHSFILKASDSQGLSAEQIINIKIENKNDAPFQSEKLLEFIKQQRHDDQSVVNEDAIFIDKERKIDIKEWFVDPDMDIDPLESLEFQVYLESDDGNSIEISDSEDRPELNWISYNEESNELAINASDNEIGIHYLKVIVKDTLGAQASAIIPINVRWENRAPTLDGAALMNFINDINTSSTSIGTGIHNAYIENNQRSIVIALKENSDVELNLPTNLFNDKDRSIVSQEELRFKMQAVQGEDSEEFKLNPNSLIISGNTYSKGLNSSNASEEWHYILTAEDSQGKTEKIEIIMKLQRTVSEPQIQATKKTHFYDEGERIEINSLIDIQTDKNPDEILYLKIKHNKRDGQQLLIRDELNDEYLSPYITEERSEDEWILSGSIQSIEEKLKSLVIKTSDDASIDESYDLAISTYNKLGNTNLVSNTKTQAININFEAVPTIPVWSIKKPIETNNPFNMTSISDYIEASVDDKKEIISYLVETPSNRTDLIFSNSQGNIVGQSTSNGYILTSEEWSNSTLRSNESSLEEVALKIRAISTEVSNKKSLYSTEKYLEWIPTPILTENSNVLFQHPRMPQAGGSITSLPLSISVPKGTKSAILQIELPSGSSLIESGMIIRSDSQNQYQIIVGNENIKDNNIAFDLNVINPDNFTGRFDGKLSLISSSRSILNNQNYEQFANDLEQKLSIKSDDLALSWDVYRIANTPEINTDILSGENHLRYIADTQQLIIPYRNGVSSQGKRNFDEKFMFNISGIPDGFTLATKVGDKYISYGATDSFGTSTLISIDNSERNKDQLGEYSLLLGGELYLVAKDGKNTSDLNIETIDITISAAISDDETASSNTNSAETTASVNLESTSEPQYIKLSELPSYVDPLIISLRSDGKIPLISSKMSNVYFEMIPGLDKLKTGWIRNNLNSHESGFLIYNSQINSNEDINISSITELFSEYFQANGWNRSFYSGTDALRSLDSNNDGKINKDDDSWENIGVWFDDGDAISQREEIISLSDVILEIDLNSVESLNDNASWAESNYILRKLNAVDEESIYSLYDVGLSLDLETSETLIPLHIPHSISLVEQGDIVEINIHSPESKGWHENGSDLLTLVRLSGLPGNITPSLGIQDRRGDWIFTWADLSKNNNMLGLIPDSDWSGDANIQILVSQIQQDGSIKTSAIKSIGIDVKAIADRAIINLNDIKAEEDSSIKLSDIYNKLMIGDKDGSESIHYEISDLPVGMQLVDPGSGRILDKNNELDAYYIGQNEIGDLILKPAKNASGLMEFTWKTVSTENTNGDSISALNTVRIQLDPKADKLNPIILSELVPTLQEGSQVNLTQLIEYVDKHEILSDHDGSEELLIRLGLPQGLGLKNNSHNAWTPIRAVMDESSKVTYYEIRYEDIQELIIFDQGVKNVNDIKVRIMGMSREISNGSIHLGDEMSLLIPFERNAKPATINLLPNDAKPEDSNGWNTGDLFNIVPENANDDVTLVLFNIPSGLVIENPDGVNKSEDSVRIPYVELHNWRIKGDENVSGIFKINFLAESKPQGAGNIANTFIKEIEINIEAKADKPVLNIDGSQQEINVSSTGWIDLTQSINYLQSSDQDGSENLYVKVNFLDEEGGKLNIPENAKPNTQFYTVKGDSWLISQAEVETLKIYVGDLENQIQLELTPIAQDGSDQLGGDTKLIQILPKDTLKAPILEISRNLQGDEDTEIPLLQDNGGVIDVSHRDNNINANLDLKISELPFGTEVIKKIINDDGSTSYTSALNRDEQGNILSSLRLNYAQWRDVYLKGPKDLSGSFEFTVQAFAINKNGQEKYTQEQKLDLLINPINDAPRVIDSSDLKPIDEGEFGRWNIADRFKDIDNSVEDLSFTAKLLGSDGVIRELPSWLSLSANGILEGTPKNEDVGEFHLMITVTDSLGLQSTGNFFMAIGNINNPPIVNHSLLLSEEWQRLDETKINEYVKSVNLRDRIEIQLGNNSGTSTGGNSIFSDPDNMHKQEELTFSIGDEHSGWGNQIIDLAEIKDNKLILNPKTKSMVGEQFIAVKATDATGSSTILNLVLNVINVNDPPIVIRDTAIEVTNQRWKENIEISEGDSNWSFNPGVIFSDIDPNDRLDIQPPQNIPAWLKLENDGTLSGTPSNDDVGELELTWRAQDSSGESAFYSLNLNIINKNTAPFVNTSIKKIIGIEDEFSQINLNDIFADFDSIHGDQLRFNYSLMNANSEEIDPPDWLRINTTSTEAVNSENKLLLQPVMYKIKDDGSLGDVIKSTEVASIKPNTKVRIVIEASDFRDVEMKGLIGIDLDITWSQNMQLESNSEQISAELPLFNSIEQKTNGMIVKAGSAPDGFNIGGMVGDDQNESVISFDMILIDPENPSSVRITPGQGSKRDGILDRYANRVENTSSVVNSFSTNDSGFLEILSPPYDTVGEYELVLTAKDQYNESATTTIKLVVENTNDHPYIKAKAYRTLKNFFGQSGQEGNAIGEGTKTTIEQISLFGDEDLLHTSTSGDALSIQIIEDDNNKLNAFQLSSQPDGMIELSINPPKGLHDFVEQRIRLEAIDSSGSRVSTDWFTATFTPIAEATQLTTGAKKRPLNKTELGHSARKNTILDISNLLGINAVELNDYQGDQAIVKLIVPFADSSLSFEGLDDSSITTKSTLDGRNEFSIDLELLGNNDNRQFGDLTGLQLKIPGNELLMLPDNLTKQKESGIPIEVWTETRVKNDIEQKFNVAKTEASTFWIKLENNTPIFNQPSAKKVDASVETNISSDEDRLLFKLDDMINDNDYDDLKQISVEIPDELIGNIFFDQKSNEIKIRPEINSYTDLPQGIFNIGVRVLDSSGIIGDPSGFESGKLQLLIVGEAESESTTLGLNLMQTIDSASISTLLKKENSVLSEDEKQLQDVLQLLNVIPESIDASEVSDDSINTAITFIERLQKGTLAVLHNKNEDAGKLLILETSSSNNILLDAELQDANKAIIEESSRLLSTQSDVIIEAPLGELNFSVDTKGNDVSIVNLQVPEGGDIQNLVKTISDGTPHIFNTELLRFTGKDEELSSWLDQISYGIYYYNKDQANNGDRIFNMLPDEQSLAFSLVENGFEVDIIPDIDGSGYLIDTDNDGQVDMISLMLVDQGWFDTRKDAIGLIGDPLTPVSLRKVRNEQEERSSNDQPDLIEQGPTIPTEADLITDTDPIADPDPITDTDSITDPDPITDTDSITDTEPITDPDPITDTDSITDTEPITDPDPGSEMESTTDKNSTTTTDEEESKANQTSKNTGSISYQKVDKKAKSNGIKRRASNVFRLFTGSMNTSMYSMRYVNNLNTEMSLSSNRHGAVSQGRDVSSLQENNSLDQQSNNESQAEATSEIELINWLEGKGRQMRDLFDKSVGYILGDAKEKGITNVIALLFVPLAAERVASSTLKSIKQPQELKLVRRNSEFYGNWIMTTRDGKRMFIEKNNQSLSIREAATSSDKLAQNKYEMLPGFNNTGESFLYRALEQSSNQGSIVSAIEEAYVQLQLHSEVDINWLDWLDKHFMPQKRDRPWERKDDHLKNIKKLSILLTHAMVDNPTMADIIMLGQLQDCCEYLGMHKLIQTSLNEGSVSI